MDRSAPQPIYLKDYTPPSHLIDTVELDIALEPNATRVHSKLAIRPNPASPHGNGLSLHGVGLHLDRLALNESVLGVRDYELTEAGLLIPNAPAEPFELEITTLCDPESNKALSGLYRSREIYCTQCEPEGFRRITYFLDRPDVLSVYTVRLEADRDQVPVLLANGNPGDSAAIAGTNRHFARWHDPHPKPSYLFAMVGGDLSVLRDVFTTESGRIVDLAIYVEPGKEDRCQWAMESLQRAMAWDERRFGREYDLDIFMIVAVSDFNMGAMENKGLNIFNDKLILARPDTATDADYMAIEAVIAHEYFHNWSGNRVTCRDWFQLCLKEGLTVFRDQEFTADMRSESVKRISDVRTLKAHQFPEDGGPLAHPVRPDSYIEINNFYTATVYEKGAEICRMLQTRLGRDGFRKGLDLYFDRHDGEAATVEDFLTAMADANGADIDAFAEWYAQAGTPELTCELAFDSDAKVAELTVSQVTGPTPGQDRKRPLPIPLRIGLLGANGGDLPLANAAGGEITDGLIELRERSQVFRFPDITSRPVASLLRGFSAPVNLVSPQTDAELEFLMANDSDLFNRWQASQRYVTRLLTGSVEALRAGAAPASGKAFARALGATLHNAELEPAFRAELLKIPSEADIARELHENVDTDAIHRARNSVRGDIRDELGSLLLETYETHANGGSYSPDAASVGRRDLRNTALSLLCARAEPGDIERVRAHYFDAQNMTDKMAALSILTHIENEARREVFADFYETWKDDHVVIDKWFALQAMSSLPDTPERVTALRSHAHFSIDNPNKVRALIGAFATANTTGFNRADGAGYNFVADAILEIGAFNPQVAARLSGAFKSWKKLEPVRQGHARAALERISAHDGLSRDVFEIVTKTLA
jgi:aminopeptidase N